MDDIRRAVGLKTVRRRDLQLEAEELARDIEELTQELLRRAVSNGQQKRARPLAHTAMRPKTTAYEVIGYARN